MQAIGLCRFSYPAKGGFQIEHETLQDRLDFLYAKDRMEERFRFFETVALPCLRKQTDTDFDLIVVVGTQLPEQYRARLYDLTADIPQIHIHAEPPRKHREVMKDILNAARNDPSEPCLQFRYDDDDAISVDFIEKLRKTVKQCGHLLRGKRSVAFDWNQGYVAELDAKGIRAAQIFRQFCVTSLGMYIRGNCPLTIMNYAHDKIPRHMPAFCFNDPAMFVRGHNSYCDSRQKNAKHIPVETLTPEEETLFKERFAIDIDHVRKVFSQV